MTASPFSAGDTDVPELIARITLISTVSHKLFFCARNVHHELCTQLGAQNADVVFCCQTLRKRVILAINSERTVVHA